MSDKTGGPAFPNESAMYTEQRLGMTLRDYFAAKAMQSMLANPSLKNNDKSISDAEAIANAAFIMADAMLSERAK